MAHKIAEKAAPALHSDNTPTAVDASPTPAERFFFDNNGYLVLEEFLDADHVNDLLQALHRVIQRRRNLQEREFPHAGITTLTGEKSTRIFYILDDDPLFLQMLDWPAIWPYVTGLLNARPHHHASDAIIEHGSDLIGRGLRWHIDGIDDGFRNLGPQIPLLQLKIGYYLSDMTQPGQAIFASCLAATRPPLPRLAKTCSGGANLPGLRKSARRQEPPSCSTMPSGTPPVRSAAKMVSAPCSITPTSIPG